MNSNELLNDHQILTVLIGAAANVPAEDPRAAGGSPKHSRSPVQQSCGPRPHLDLRPPTPRPDRVPTFTWQRARRCPWP